MKIRNVIALFCLQLFFVAFAAAVVFAEVGYGTVTGRVQLSEKQESISGGVYLFDTNSGPAPDPLRYLRVPELIDMLRPDGSFSIAAPPGVYYLGLIVRRTNGPELGPPRTGDMVIVSRDMEQKAVKYAVAVGKTLDAGTLSQAHEYRPAPPAFDDPMDLATGIAGKVLDTDKKPVGVVVVLAYPNIEMTGIPVYVSEKSMPDGSYLLRTGGAGTFYLRVRAEYGGGPMVEGELIGVYGGETPTPVKVKEHMVTRNTDITVKKLPPVGPERRAVMEGASGKQKASAPDKPQGGK